MDLALISKELENLFKSLNFKDFFGTSGGLAAGSGLIYSNIRMPIFVQSKNAFATGNGLGLVLTHECDIDVKNDRPFSDHAIIAPIVPAEKLWAELSKQTTIEHSRSFLISVAQGQTYRLFYLPPFAGSRSSPLVHGGFIDFNKITSTHISYLRSEEALLALTKYGMRKLDSALQNHLFREKSQGLPLPE